MYSSDIDKFPVDFMNHFYNFAAEELGNTDNVESLNPPGPALLPQEYKTVLPSVSQDQASNALLSGYKRGAISSSSNANHDQMQQPAEYFPLVSEVLSHKSDPMSPHTTPMQPETSFSRGKTSPFKAVPIAPKQSCVSDSMARVVEAAVNQEMVGVKELEVRALRAYHRKIRNRESAARSNLARKRRRQLQRMERKKKEGCLSGR